MSLSPLVAGVRVTERISLVRPLKEGGMGAVWLAQHETLKSTVAVKFILPEKAESADLKARFAREAWAAARVKSPHVVAVHDTGTMADGTLFLVMEHVEGEALDDRLEHAGALAVPDAITVVTHVARALDACHRKRIVHRDVKPSNIVVAQSGRELFARLLDFGIAKDLSAPQCTQGGTVLGTLRYMSPEQLASADGVDEQADIWALAATAYETLTGHPAFDGATPLEIRKSIRSGSAPPGRDLEPNVVTVFAKAFTLRRGDRYRSALELADALEAATSGGTASPRVRTLAAAPLGGTPTTAPGTARTPDTADMTDMAEPEAIPPTLRDRSRLRAIARVGLVGRACPPAGCGRGPGPRRPRGRRVRRSAPFRRCSPRRDR